MFDRLFIKLGLEFTELFRIKQIASILLPFSNIRNTDVFLNAIASSKPDLPISGHSTNKVA
ncbi:hypothetical protein GX50_04401 [[Emmonsia] crescens]|uniref:Uncharacterized protein n=1 Tax=[Emmonsia] crescens TaxID=73230 RepID=A0A2B7ZHJ2_9EURO|nr:hypothetical protein GX50_04401 [Emmonsia crescens]